MEHHGSNGVKDHRFIIVTSPSSRSLTTTPHTVYTQACWQPNLNTPPRRPQEVVQKIVLQDCTNHLHSATPKVSGRRY